MLSFHLVSAYSVSKLTIFSYYHNCFYYCQYCLPHIIKEYHYYCYYYYCTMYQLYAIYYGALFFASIGGASSFEDDYYMNESMYDSLGMPLLRSTYIHTYIRCNIFTIATQITLYHYTIAYCSFVYIVGSVGSVENGGGGYYPPDSQLNNSTSSFVEADGDTG